MTVRNPNRWSRWGAVLEKTRSRLAEGLANVFTYGGAMDDTTLNELESSLLTADVGATTTTQILDRLQRQIKKRNLRSQDQWIDALETELLHIADQLAQPFAIEKDAHPFVILVTGVNGVGKTTTIGKLGHRLKQEGYSIMLAAADTYRAAAIDQLRLWGQENSIPVVAQHTGADSASVAHDAFQVAKSRGIDVLIVDTAGRLHSNKSLMDELGKVYRVIQKLDPTAPQESILILDGTIGQNALAQVKQFNAAVHLSGLIITKLDGTAKGGVVLALPSTTSLPLYFVGVGESLDALQPFAPADYVAGLMGR